MTGVGVDCALLILGAHYAPEVTGNAPYTESLATGLLSKGFEVRVVTTFPHYPESRVRDGYRGWSMSEAIQGVPVRRLRHYVPTQPTMVRRLLSELSFGLRLISTRWRQPDALLLVSPSLFSSAIALLRARLRRHRPAIIVWVQDLYSVALRERHTRGLLGRLGEAVEGIVLHSADGVVVVHESFRSLVTEKFGVPSERVEVIRNWSHVAVRSVEDRRAVRRSYGWGDDELVVLHAGNIGVKQGLESVVEAAQIADRAGAPVRFVLVGDGNQRDRILGMAEGTARLELWGLVAEEALPELLSASDVLLVNELPGLRAAAVPSKLTTYFAAGRPVVAATESDSTAACEIRASGAGVVVAPGDARALLDAVMSLGANPEYAETLGAAGRDYCARVLDADSAIERYACWIGAVVDRT